jgi:hypothetical protein
MPPLLGVYVESALAPALARGWPSFEEAGGSAEEKLPLTPPCSGASPRIYEGAKAAFLCEENIYGRK